MTARVGLPVRDREWARASASEAGRVAGPRCWAERERTGVWAARLGWTGGRKENRPEFDFVFLFQNYE
jgi:hypothetical protein